LHKASSQVESQKNKSFENKNKILFRLISKVFFEANEKLNVKECIKVVLKLKTFLLILQSDD
jgi:hypothetical protein